MNLNFCNNISISNLTHHEQCTTCILNNCGYCSQSTTHNSYCFSDNDCPYLDQMTGNNVDICKVETVDVHSTIIIISLTMALVCIIFTIVKYRVYRYRNSYTDERVEFQHENDIECVNVEQIDYEYIDINSCPHNATTTTAILYSNNRIIKNEEMETILFLGIIDNQDNKELEQDSNDSIDDIIIVATAV